MPCAPPLARLLGLLDDIVDEKVGIVRRVQMVPREAGAPDFFHVAAQACQTRAFSRQANFGAAGGASTDRDVAIAKAVGEAVERYCAALFEVEELPLDTYRDAPFPCVSPSEFALFRPEQYRERGFPWAPFDEDTPVRWRSATELGADDTCYVPAAMVYVPYYYYQGSGDTPIVQPISTGLACHTGSAEAMCGALCEVIERDVFTITWQARIPRPHIRVETLSDVNYDIVQRFERTGSSVTLFDLDLDLGVPSVLAVLRSDSPAAPALVFAAASDLDPERAVRKSLEELAHTRRYSQEIVSRLPRLDEDPAHANVVDQISHLNFWCDHAHTPLANFLFSSEKRISFGEINNLASGDAEADCQTLVDKLAAIGHRALMVDLTTEDVRSLGLSVVRAIVPGFHPLFMGHRLRALGGRRLWEVPRKLGLNPSDRIDNPAPHPYP